MASHLAKAGQWHKEIEGQSLNEISFAQFCVCFGCTQARLSTAPLGDEPKAAQSISESVFGQTYL